MNFQDGVDLMAKHIEQTIRKMVHDQVCGCSLDCLRQNTPTTGLSVPVSVFGRVFDAAVGKAKRPKSFTITGC